jgi:osmotically-inducible protein OsmY
MADYRDQRDQRDQRNWGRNDPRGFDDRGYEGHGEQRREAGGHPRHDYERDHDRSVGGFGRGSARDRMGSEQFRSQDEFGGYGEHEYQDFGRGQPGGAYEHSGGRDYRHGSGYGGFGQSPGESGGGFGSGRTYAAEPGWGPDYGQQGSRAGSGRAFEGQGGHPGGYGTQRGGYGEPVRYGQGRYGPESSGQGQRSGYSGEGYSGRGFAPSGQSYGHPGQFGQSGFGEAGHSYAQQGFGQSQPGYAREDWRGSGSAGQQRRYGRGPKGYQRSDERLKEDISERLMSAMHVDASEVSVEVKDGKVTLEGSVPERRMKHCIEDMVDDCMGVKDIDNRIRVGQSATESGSEATMAIGGGQGGASGSGQGLSGSSLSSTSGTRSK